MVRVSCQCCIFTIASVFFAARPTLELFVGKPSSLVSERLESATDRDGEVEMYQEPLTYRPNERDKLFASSQLRLQRKTKKMRRKRSEASQRSDSFVFPDQVPTSETPHRLDDRLFVVPSSKGPPSCAGTDTFCESVDEYPAEHVVRLLRKEPVFVRGFFQEEKKQYSLTDDVQDRIDASDENPLCISQEHTVYPKMAKNVEGNWLFVINQDEYVQGVRVEKCLYERECSFPVSLPNGYKSLCKQKYIYRKLVAVNGTGQGVISDSFQFPSCCSCVIKLDHSVAHNRFGGNLAALPLTLPKTTPVPPKNKKKN